MIIIHSSEFVDAEFESEVGLIPPCMLPIGNKKMLELQVDYFRKVFHNEKIVVTLPKTYPLTINEQAVITKLGIYVQRICNMTSFAEAILSVLNVNIDSVTDHIRILHSNLLLGEVPLEPDCVALASPCRHNDWYDQYRHQDYEPRWLGYFSFSSRFNLTKALTKALTQTSGNFSTAIVHYQSLITMKQVQLTDWYNCRHFNSYFDARSSITTQRSFNALTIESGMVTKSSDNDVKIQAEIYWFSHLPPALKCFTPQLIDSGRLQDGITTYYRLEFLPLLPLNELYVHGRNPTWFWHRIFNLVQDYFGHATHEQYLSQLDMSQIDACRVDLYRKKTFGRLHSYQASTHIDLYAPIFYQGSALGSIVDIANDCIEQTLKLPSRAVIMHGDLCFSNMLFDSRARRLKLIDPRGIDCHDNFSIYGDITYDLAKLAHSVVGMYDFIIAGNFEIVPDIQTGTGDLIHFDIDERLERIQSDFLRFNFVDGIVMSDIMPAVVLLFLSMLPLHADRPDRQRAMLLNAFRLYQRHVHHAQIDNVAYNDHMYTDVLES